jgi:catechol 2,3-dioxygenase-like lactoylglutathione lyase family enzyme
MINGAHVVVYTRDAEADREFCRDVLGFPCVDAGGEWLIFSLPPTEMAFHPAQDQQLHELFLMCDNLQVTMQQLAERGVEFSQPVSHESWGARTAIRLPGGGEVGLYEPRHARAADRQ